jgi:hypothetical protein
MFPVGEAEMSRRRTGGSREEQPHMLLRFGSKAMIKYMAVRRPIFRNQCGRNASTVGFRRQGSTKQIVSFLRCFHAPDDGTTRPLPGPDDQRLSRKSLCSGPCHAFHGKPSFFVRDDSGCLNSARGSRVACEYRAPTFQCISLILIALNT